MKFSSDHSTLATWLALAACVSGIPSPTIRQVGTNLRSWPPAAAASLDAMIARNANQSNFAVFDMDQTSYRYDLTESLLPFMENRGLLNRTSIDSSLLLIPFKDTANYTETLYSYYNRLCGIDDKVCYPWIAQVFSGYTLRQLKVQVDALMSSNQVINTTYWSGPNVTSISVNPPRIYPGQVELYNELMRNNITVYVMTAANEEIVRMVASDPKYGYNVPPQNVIGVSMLLKNTTDNNGTLTTARKQIAAGTYNETANLDLVLTPYLWSPLTWFSGKWAAILEYIDQWKKPVLVAGDTPVSDGYMLFQGVDVSKGGIHLWVNRRQAYYETILKWQTQYAEAQAANGVPVTADKNWVVVVPADIQGSSS